MDDREADHQKEEYKLDKRLKNSGRPQLSAFCDRTEETQDGDELAVLIFVGDDGKQIGQNIVPAELLPTPEDDGPEGFWYQTFFILDKEKTKQEREEIRELQNQLIERGEQ